jgi:predicted MPP superfamily phosphohydrolase
MPYVLLATAAAGHVILWVMLVNRLHALAMNRKLMHALTALCGLALVAIPPALVSIQLRHWQFEPAPAKPLSFAEIVSWCYYLGCIVVCIAAAAHRLWAVFHPERRGAMLANHTTRHDLKQAVSEPLTGRGLDAWLARLPGNQVLDVYVHEKQLAIPRLPAELAGLRIAHLSDLHMSGRIERGYFRAVAERVNQCRPDIIAVTGDLVERAACIDWIPDTLGRLQAPGGVYYVLGNHDKKVNTNRLTAALAEAGLIHVGGRTLNLTWQNSPLLLAGNELPWFGPAPPCRVLSHQSPALRILLSHSPDQFAWAQEHDFDLMLAGHNHGGQVRLPLFGPLLAPSLHGIRYASGVFRGGDTILHVSRGTASHTPLRYNCPPEIAILVLQSAT